MQVKRLIVIAPQTLAVFRIKTVFGFCGVLDAFPRLLVLTAKFFVLGQFSNVIQN